MENRIERLRGLMAHEDFDAFMIMVEENRRWLTGFTGEDAQHDESAGCLFVNKDQVLLATDSRYVTQAERECPFCKVYCYTKGLPHALPDITNKLNIQRLGFEPGRLSVRDHQKMLDSLDKARSRVLLVQAGQIVEGMRVVKDADEIQAVRDALAISEEALSRVLPALSPGMTEAQAAWELEKTMRELGADGLAFPSIVASGPNSALPHAGVSNRVIRVGEPLLFDWGAKLNGYCSDISRATVLGEPTDGRFKEVFNAVLEAQEKAIRIIAPGVSSRDVDQQARRHIEDAGFGGKFGHGLGHGVGLAVHEGPRISPLADTVLKPGMVFTVEPGIYLPEWGGVRLENMVAVTGDGVEVLNRLGQFFKG